jgi:4-amino-4-deoxy-L-arabinose transferase-like glycosyltransferase
MTETRTRWVVTILLLAVLGRVVAALVIGGDFKFADEAVYVDTARRLAGGGGFGVEYRRVPAYPVFLAALSLGLPVGLAFVRVAQAAVAGLGAVLVFELADRIVGRRTAVAAGLICALDPLLVIAAGLLYPESVAALVLLLAVLLALDAAERDRPARSAGAGLLLGILALLRPTALILPPVVAIWIAWTVRARGARRVTHAGALGIAFLLALVPWTARNLRVHGELLPVATAGTQTAPVGQEEVAREGLARSLARWVWDNPGAFIVRGGRQFLQFWELSPTTMSSDDPAVRLALHRRDPRMPAEPVFSRRLRDLVSAVSFGVELLLALVGLVLVGRTRWRGAMLPLAVILAFALAHALFVATLRYRITVLPLVFLFSGIGAERVLSRVGGRWSGRESEPAENARGGAAAG